ncbi:MAG: hypothetical protein J5621_05035 [Paludibacteraceae bacterium]|nr:hypothetical protein [Paludibacteraceae bacterium]
MKKLFMSFVMIGLLSILSSCTEGVFAELGTNTCRRVTANNDDGQAALFHMPLASMEELDAYADADESIIPYRLARQYAFIEFVVNAEAFFYNDEYAYSGLMEFYKSRFEYCPITLTNRPAIVYNYDGTPYYYEFGVIMPGKLLTTITVYAHKMSDQLIAYVGAARYKSLDFQCKRYVGMYPHVYYYTGEGEESPWTIPVRDQIYHNEMVMLDASVPSEPLYTNPLDVLKYKLSSIPEVELDIMNNSLRYERRVNYKDWDIIKNISSLVEYEAYCSALYESSMNTLNERLETLANDEIKDEFTLSEFQKKTIDIITSEEKAFTYYLPEYQNERLRFTQWAEACGPAAMSWLYRGKWDSYKGMYLPIYGDGEVKNDCINFKQYDDEDYGWYDIVGCEIAEEWGLDLYDNVNGSLHVDNGLCGNWYKYTHWVINGDALYASGMEKGLYNATEGKSHRYITRFTVLPRSWICDKHEPVVVECSPAPDRIPHYLAAIGVTYNQGRLGNPKNVYCLVTDNGYQTDYHGYYPYWHAYNFWNLHYGWEEYKH